MTRHPLTIARRQRGFSLVELMVSLVIGLIVTGAAMGVFVGTLGANSTQMKISRLNNDLRTAMTYITRDLKRTGYKNWTIAQLAAGDFDTNGQTAPVITSSATAGSVAVSYDINSDGTFQRYSFRLSGGAIQALVGTTGAWTNITDPTVVTITAFSITDRSPAGIQPTGATITVTVPVYEIALTGRLVSDSSITRTVTETVRIRNALLS